MANPPSVPPRYLVHIDIRNNGIPDNLNLVSSKINEYMRLKEAVDPRSWVKHTSNHYYELWEFTNSSIGIEDDLNQCVVQADDMPIGVTVYLYVFQDGVGRCKELIKSQTVCDPVPIISQTPGRLSATPDVTLLEAQFEALSMPSSPPPSNYVVNIDLENNTGTKRSAVCRAINAYMIGKGGNDPRTLMQHSSNQYYELWELPCNSLCTDFPQIFTDFDQSVVQNKTLPNGVVIHFYVFQNGVGKGQSFTINNNP